MSFNDLHDLQDLEAQASGFSDESQPSPEFTQLARSISQNIFQITSNVSSIHRSIGLLGTPRDTDQMRSALMDTLSKTQRIIKETLTQIKTLNAWDPATIAASQRYEQGKLTGEFQKATTDFQNAQKLALEKEKEHLRAAKATIAEGSHENELDRDERVTEGPTEQRLQLLNHAEVAYNEQLIDEREAEILGIEQGITELNEIFRDLATIVMEQGTLVDNIEENVNRTTQHTRQAAKELTQANRWQRSARTRACYVMLIFCVILTIVLLAILS